MAKKKIINHYNYDFKVVRKETVDPIGEAVQGREMKIKDILLRNSRGVLPVEVKEGIYVEGLTVDSCDMEKLAKLDFVDFEEMSNSDVERLELQLAHDKEIAKFKREELDKKRQDIKELNEFRKERAKQKAEQEASGNEQGEEEANS